MKTSHWSLLGYAIGILFAVGTFVRYYIMYPDVDKAITDIITGLIICALSWLYNKQLYLSNKLGGVEDYLAEIK